MQSTRLRKCKLGNWQEEVAFELDKKAMVSKAREQAQTQHGGGQGGEEAGVPQKDSFFKLASTAATNVASLSAQIVAKRDHHLQPARLGPVAPGGFIPFGMPLMLQSAETNGFLSVDLHDRQGVGRHMKIVATTSVVAPGAAPKPALRNTWVLLPVPEDIEMIRMRYEAMRSVATVRNCGNNNTTDPAKVLHYGQRFILSSLEEMALPACHGEAPGCVFLASEARTAHSQARRSNAQEAFFTPFASQKTWWTAVHAHPDYRIDMEMTPVKADSMFLIRHQLTAVPLACTKAMYPNDFGAEYEVSAHKHLRVMVKNGNSLETDANFWCVLCAPPLEDDPVEDH